jgi:hypothetical protein
LPRYIKIGRFVFSADLAAKRDGLRETSFILTGEAAETFQAHMDSLAVPWRPLRLGPPDFHNRFTTHRGFPS